ncbi:MAG: bifunctional N-acetylglucosamine-1-phosphate uridyltransferase/glucosamine-1-phosphate acetyltransferase [Rhodospirillaceae bacterium]|nr:bifunctional N-acetylglucosamine-1-phosphate uridyltransferase/glucosamine-1-phosphate acetyltransferase [Rhodospirillaceae bacterium]|tara:strand:+ start:224 stop:1591 length:1368 start_codon:yes stop_codon:yes gene_type:complete
MTKSNVAAVILAAGEGTRMKSALPKVLHRIAGQPMVCYLINRLSTIETDQIVIVTSPVLKKEIELFSSVEVVVQDPPLGTAHAVLAAEEALKGFDGDVLVLFGDTPLLTEGTIQAMVEVRRGKNNPALVVLGFSPDDPGEYGRLVKDLNGGLEKIVEFCDANEDERKIGLCNAGIMAIDGKRLFQLLNVVADNNSKSEFFLTDIVGIARSKGWGCLVLETDDPDEVMGVNSRTGLAEAESAFQYRMRLSAMESGVTLQDPDTVWFSFDTQIGKDVVIGPNVVFGPGVVIGDNVEIRAFCHIEGAKIDKNAIIGPFARLRQGTDIGPDAQIGNFVEVKEARLDQGAKANHLSYIGDSRVGAGANIGAGTITCNYDGFLKSHTEIGAGAFIGSNTSLVAPVKINAGAITGAGSVITKDVEDNALGISRAPQEEHKGWALKYRLRKQANKDKMEKKAE